MLKILQWNIWFNEKIENIISELNRFDTDIVCIQELSITNNDISNIDKLKKLYPYMYYEIADTFSDGRSQCNAILSKYPIKNTYKFFVQKPTEDKNDYSKEGRVYIEVGIVINEKYISIGTTHLSYTDRFKETELKDQEGDNLIKCINKKDNYIFTGDLNASKNSKYVKEIEKYLVNYNTSNTWTTKPFSYQGFNEDKLNWKLDYVFTTSDIIVDEVKVLKTNYSDHLPIQCNIIL